MPLGWAGTTSSPRRSPERPHSEMSIPWCSIRSMSPDTAPTSPRAAEGSGSVTAASAAARRSSCLLENSDDMAHLLVDEETALAGPAAVEVRSAVRSVLVEFHGPGIGARLGRGFNLRPASRKLAALAAPGFSPTGNAGPGADHRPGGY